MSNLRSASQCRSLVQASNSAIKMTFIWLLDNSEQNKLESASNTSKQYLKWENSTFMSVHNVLCIYKVV